MHDTYDLAGRITSTTGPRGVVGASYDDNGNLATVTPPGRPAYSLSPAADDRLDAYTLPTVGGTTPSFGYQLNDDRQYSGATLADGSQIDFDYDAQGRLNTITHGSTTTSFNYASGRLASVEAPSGVDLAVGYTSGLPTSTTWSGPVAGSVSVGFDDELRVAYETVGGTAAVAFGFDDDGLLTSAGAQTLTRDDETGLLSGTSVGSVTTAVELDARGEVSRLTGKHGATTLYDVEFTERDQLGRIVERVETVQGTSHTYRYTYNTAGRLTRVTRDGTEIAVYAYDASGNITSATRDGTTTTAGAADDQDRIGAWGSALYTHTPLGERASKTESAQTTSYSWEQGRLEGVDLPDGRQIDYLTDGAGRRVGKKIDGTLTRGYLWSGGRIVAELDGSGSVLARFIYGSRAHVPDLIIKSGVTYRVVTDERGSPRLIVNTSTGVVAQKLAYDAYGRTTEDTNPGFQPFAYAGGLTDPDTGLILFGARSYDPETGRWLSRDGVGFAGGLNHYAYVDGDPINRIDPSGRSFIGCFQDILGIAGMIPVIGGAFDVANTFIYAARGKWGDAVLALGGVLLPVSLSKLGGLARFGDEALQSAAPRAIGNTADDWWGVSNVGRNRAGTLVPESFDLSVAGQKFTVHPNATKHMAEYATSHGGGGSVPISSLAGSVESAVRGGLQSGRNFIRVGPWEVGIDTRANVIYHAVYMP
ncbi:MAG: RHS repeat-associated core domain-containing protein [Actinomycetota bacterium]